MAARINAFLSRRSTQLRNHVKDTAATDSNPQTLSPYNTCTEHDGLCEDLFCVNHNSMVCSVCRRVYHGKCKNVIPILDASVNFSNRSTTDVCKTQNSHLIKQYKSVAKERSRDIKDIDAKRSDIIESVKVIKYRIIDKVEKMAAKVIDDLQKLYDTERTEMEEHLSFLNEMMHTLETNGAYIDEARKERRDLSLFISVHNLMIKQREMTKVLEQIHDEAHKVVLNFKVNDKVEAVLEDLRSIGDVTFHTKEYNVIPRPERMFQLNIDTSGYMAPEEHNIRKPASKRRAFHVEDMNIRDIDDIETCWITGMAILQDSSLLLTDTNNMRIKLLGPSHVMLNSIQLQTPPFDIALVNQQHAVFTLPDTKQINFIKITRKSEMKLDGEINLDIDCNAVSVFRDNLIVTTIAGKSVNALNMKGEVLWTVDIDRKRGRLFDWPWYVATNTIAGEIYVSDRQKNTITTLNGEGDVIHIRDVRGKGPRGMAMDDLGNLYVCYYMTDQLEIICSYQTRDRRNLLSKADGVKHPQSVSYDTQSGRLFVSAYNSNFVSIFQIN